jgi:hypothetical protein
MASSVDYSSFILRLWREPAAADTDEQGPVWMGEMESIQTGRTHRFQGLEQLQPLLVAQLAGDSQADYDIHDGGMP